MIRNNLIKQMLFLMNNKDFNNPPISSIRDSWTNKWETQFNKKMLHNNKI